MNNCLSLSSSLSQPLPLPLSLSLSLSLSLPLSLPLSLSLCLPLPLSLSLSRFWSLVTWICLCGVRQASAVAPHAHVDHIQNLPGEIKHSRGVTQCIAPGKSVWEAVMPYQTR